MLFMLFVVFVYLSFVVVLQYFFYVGFIICVVDVFNGVEFFMGGFGFGMGMQVSENDILFFYLYS